MCLLNFQCAFWRENMKSTIKFNSKWKNHLHSTFSWEITNAVREKLNYSSGHHVFMKTFEVCGPIPLRIPHSIRSCSLKFHSLAAHWYTQTVNVTPLFARMLFNMVDKRRGLLLFFIWRYRFALNGNLLFTFLFVIFEMQRLEWVKSFVLSSILLLVLIFFMVAIFFLKAL